MRQFYLAYHGHEKLQPLVGEISWAKHLAILGKCKDPLEREFYIRMTKKFGWTKNVLIHCAAKRRLLEAIVGRHVNASCGVLPFASSKVAMPAARAGSP